MRYWRVYVQSRSGWLDIGCHVRDREEAVGLARDYGRAFPRSKMRVAASEPRRPDSRASHGTMEMEANG